VPDRRIRQVPCITSWHGVWRSPGADLGRQKKQALRPARITTLETSVVKCSPLRRSLAADSALVPASGPPLARNGRIRWGPWPFRCRFMMVHASSKAGGIQKTPWRQSKIPPLGAILGQPLPTVKPNISTAVGLSSSLSQPASAASRMLQWARRGPHHDKLCVPSPWFRKAGHAPWALWRACRPCLTAMMDMLGLQCQATGSTCLRDAVSPWQTALNWCLEQAGRRHEAGLSSAARCTLQSALGRRSNGCWCWVRTGRE